MVISNISKAAPEGIRTFSLNKKLHSGINLLILLHLAVFLSSYFAENGSWSFLALTAGSANIASNWWTGMFSYQFAHSSAGELLLSMSMLWLFGQLLAQRFGERKVIFFYFISVTFCALLFLLAHWLFPVFSGTAGMLDGAFGGVLVIMTLATFVLNAQRIRFGKWTLSVFQVYLAMLAISLFFVYRHNLASLLMYAGSIYAGVQLMLWSSKQEEKQVEND